MGTPPYDDPDALDLMRADADEVSLAHVSAPPTVTHDEAETTTVGLDVPADAVALCGELHFYLD